MTQKELVDLEHYLGVQLWLLMGISTVIPHKLVHNTIEIVDCRY